MYYVYILQSEKDKRYYYGYTSDLHRRLSEHNSGKAKSTRGRRPLRLHYHEEYEKPMQAREREKFFKSKAGYAELKKKGII